MHAALPHLQLRSACMAAFRWQHTQAAVGGWAVSSIYMTGVFESEPDGMWLSVVAALQGTHIDACTGPGQDVSIVISSNTFSSPRGGEQHDSGTPAVKVVLAPQQELPLQSRVLARLRSERTLRDARPAGSRARKEAAAHAPHASTLQNLDHCF